MQPGTSTDEEADACRDHKDAESASAPGGQPRSASSTLASSAHPLFPLGSFRAHTNLKLVSKGGAYGGLLAKREPSIFHGILMDLWSMPSPPLASLAVLLCRLQSLCPSPSAPITQLSAGAKKE